MQKNHQKSSLTTIQLDIVADENRKKMAYGVTKPPARLSRRNGLLCYYGRLEYDFLTYVLCLASYFSHFLLIFHDMFIFMFLRLCNNHLLLLSAST